MLETTRKKAIIKELKFLAPPTIYIYIELFVTYWPMILKLENCLRIYKMTSCQFGLGGKLEKYQH